MTERTKFEGGYIARNGIYAVPCDESYFVHGQIAVLHFREEDWRAYGCVYPEIVPVAYRRPIDEFCFPLSGEYELFRNADEEIELRVFVSGVMSTPVLEWILPQGNESSCDMYAAFVEGI